MPTRYILVFWLFLLSAVAFLDRTNIGRRNLLRSEYHLTNPTAQAGLQRLLIGYAAFGSGGWLAGRSARRLLTIAEFSWWECFDSATAVPPDQGAFSS
jgi:ACS family glucarate transporter-like MFS transporter